MQSLFPVSIITSVVTLAPYFLSTQSGYLHVTTYSSFIPLAGFCQLQESICLNFRGSLSVVFVAFPSTLHYKYLFQVGKKSGARTKPVFPLLTLVSPLSPMIAIIYNLSKKLN